MKKTFIIALITLLGFSVSKAQTTNTGEDKIYSFVSLENPPLYPNGIAEFYKFLGENIKYPEQAKENKIQGNVFVSFVVEKSGTISNVKVVKGLGYGTDEEALRVLALSPNWEPGLKDGQPVRVKYNLPIKFSLNKVSN